MALVPQIEDYVLSSIKNYMEQRSLDYLSLREFTGPRGRFGSLFKDEMKEELFGPYAKFVLTDLPYPEREVDVNDIGTGKIKAADFDLRWSILLNLEKSGRLVSLLVSDPKDMRKGAVEYIVTLSEKKERVIKSFKRRGYNIGLTSTQ